jgi:hypothetical protein
MRLVISQTYFVNEEYRLLGYTPCSPLKVNRRFGGTHRLHLKGRNISQARNQRESRWQAEALARIILRP